MAGVVAAVLTKDRPDILARSVSMLADHHPGIAAMVIDDSAARSAVEENGRALARAASLGAAYHVTAAAAAALCREIDGATGRRGAIGPLLARTAPRDISGMRNLAVVASSALRPKTLFCIDDDVVACAPRRGLPCFLDAVLDRHQSRRNAVVGARMGGIADDSYAGRLCRLCEGGGGAALLDHERHILPPSAGWRSDGNPLWTEPAARRPRARRVPHVSGGMMAVRVGPRRIVPFPPGYNEDWNWCLLQSMLEGTEVLEDGHPAYHSPPALRRPDAAGIVWESLGDIMLYALRRAAAAGARHTLPSLRRRVSREISGGYTVGEITYTIGLLGGLAAGAEGPAAAARASEHRAELSAAASLLRGRDLRAFAAGWFDEQERRAASLALALGPGGPQDVIRGAVERLSA